MGIKDALEFTREMMKEDFSYLNPILERHGINFSGFHNWKVIPTKGKNVFGVCKYYRKEIGLSAIMIPECTDNSIYNTITHELAHAIAGSKHRHDNVWREIHIALGGDGERCSDDNSFLEGRHTRKKILSNHANYIATCPSCGEVYYKIRKPQNGKRHSCGKCSSRFNRKYLLTFKHISFGNC